MAWHCSPQGPGGGCRWLFQPWLFTDTDLTNPGKRWQEPHPCSEHVQGGGGGGLGLRRGGRTMGMLLSQHYKPVTALWGGGYAAFSVCQSQRDCRRMREGQEKCFPCMLKAFCHLTAGSETSQLFHQKSSSKIITHYETLQFKNICFPLRHFAWLHTGGISGCAVRDYCTHGPCYTRPVPLVARLAGQELDGNIPLPSGIPEGLLMHYTCWEFQGPTRGVNTGL